MTTWDQPITPVPCEVKTFGNPWHGLLYGGKLYNDTGQTVRKSGTVSPSAGNTVYVKIPGLPTPVTPAAASAAGMKFERDAVLFGLTKSYSPLVAGGVGSGTLYRDPDGVVWTISYTLESVPTLVSGQTYDTEHTLKVWLGKRFGRFGGEKEPSTNKLLATHTWQGDRANLGVDSADWWFMHPRWWAESNPDLTRAVWVMHCNGPGPTIAQPRVGAIISILFSGNAVESGPGGKTAISASIGVAHDSGAQWQGVYDAVDTDTTTPGPGPGEWTRVQKKHTDVARYAGAAWTPAGDLSLINVRYLTTTERIEFHAAMPIDSWWWEKNTVTTSLGGLSYSAEYASGKIGFDPGWQTAGGEESSAVDYYAFSNNVFGLFHRPATVSAPTVPFEAAVGLASPVGVSDTGLFVIGYSSGPIYTKVRATFNPRTRAIYSRTDGVQPAFV